MVRFKFKYICLFACFLQDTKCYANILTCGIENSNITVTKEGSASIERFPWMGLLFYPFGKKRYTTFVILVTRQMVVGSAIEIDKFPKNNFRRKTKVVLGQQCGEHEQIGVRDYTYHPDYTSNTYSALAIVQLDTDHVRELHPICPPPDFLVEPTFFAMTIVGECTKSTVKNIQIYKMKYVDEKHCKTFYRRTGLDVGSFWPSHTTCARALSGDTCLWRSGTALVVKQRGHWRLLGVGIYGPGCKAPARFLDYGMYHQWTLQSVRRVGYPAITRVDTSHIILRRKMSNLQKFGPCDDEEKTEMLYQDKITILARNLLSRSVYNLTLISQYEYKCIILKAKFTSDKFEYTKIDITNLGMKGANDIKDVTKGKIRKPAIYLRRWCSSSTSICHDVNVEVNFYVEILFSHETTFTVHCYGRAPKIMDPKAVIKYRNRNATHPPLLRYRKEILEYLKLKKGSRTNYWFYKDDFNL